MNLFFKSRHVVKSDDIDMKIGMALHIIFSSIAKSVRDFGGSHVVMALEGKSWRRDLYPQYKLARREARDERTPEEKEEDELFFQAYDDFLKFMENQTNVTVLQHPRCEADDFIARWIQNHPDDKHVIISSDSDYYQLISDNVSQYNGVKGEHITINGIFNDRGKPVIDNKTKEQKSIGDPEYVLFEKCIRGDKTDGIFSAYPGVRKKGTKNKIGILEAYADRVNKGFNWNNFMLQRWVDHEGNEHKVIDKYNLNRTLIDLSQQPEDIKQALDETIIAAVQKEPVTQVGIKFMKFCGKYSLDRIAQNATEHAEYLNARYNQID
jgi:5'-3' exonuclease